MRSSRLYSSRRGMSLIEVTIVVIILGVLLASAAPSFRRSIEQSHADIAGANLRSIWTAERLYWLDNGHRFTDSLSELKSMGLVDPTIVAAERPYEYDIATNDDGTTFTATATRSGSTTWAGGFTIDQTGTFSGSVSGSGTTLQPGFLD
ncbi:MAG TPA: prepilin-type N-terminal cleavage/methylation domain-containing protein [Thermoguttaceae bacterium]|nr:prepilin-type N-terminal cleavage/methylation domain-containing protein [Thermoguttaceae bacterium]